MAACPRRPARPLRRLQDRHSDSGNRRVAGNMRASTNVDVAATGIGADLGVAHCGVWIVAIAAGTAASAATIARPTAQDLMLLLTVVISSSKQTSPPAWQLSVAAPSRCVGRFSCTRRR